MDQIALDWVLGWARTAEEEPQEWVPASVPGNVQVDWARAHGWPEWWVGDNFKQYRWMEDVVWVYRTTLPEVPSDSCFQLCGIDHDGVVRLNGKKLGKVCGMQSTTRAFNLEGANAGDRLEVLVTVPKLNAWAGNDRTRTTTKAGVFYGWDFAPRLVPIGITGEATIPTTPLLFEHQLKVLAHLGGTEGWIAIHHMNAYGGDPTRTEWVVVAPSGEIIDAGTADGHDAITTVRIPDVQRWYPNGHGSQPLYTVHQTVKGKTFEWRVGFCTINLVPYEGMWSEGHAMPSTRWEPPITVEVNGRPIFAKGANWVPPSMFPATDDRETYRPLLEQCRDAGFNLIRVWGGGVVPNDAFYDLCDEMGLMVWQEFPLACGRYESESNYLLRLQKEARDTVSRLRYRTSLAIWCGGNELFCPWSQMTDQDAALRLLNSVCFENDPRRPFLPTSPLTGMAHGGYTFQYQDGREGMAAFQESRATAYAEFGSAGPASVEVLRSFIPEDELWPPRRGTAWETHHAFGAWDGDPESWLMLPMLEEYFGAFENLEAMVEAGQLLQSEGMRHCFEEARRQKPRCSMALCWCLNEPWPTAANNSLISWPATPKPAMQAVAEACRPTLFSLRIPKFRWSQGETLRMEPWVLNDAYETYPGGEAVVTIDGDEVARWMFDAIEANRNVQGTPIEVVLPEIGSRFEVTIACLDQPEWTSRYRLLRQR